MREHFASEGSLYGADQTGGKVYQFNSLGFRGEEYDPLLDERIFVCGCSYTFGTGLDYEESWPSRFRELYSKDRGLRSEKVNLLNFSQGGSSNAYIARTLVSQAQRVRPTLVVALFSFRNRFEYFIPEDVRRSFAAADPRAEYMGAAALGRWSVAQRFQSWRREFRALAVHERKLFRKSNAVAAAYYDGIYDDYYGMAMTLHSMLMLQFFCAAQGVDFVASWVQHEALTEPRFTNHPAIGPMIGTLDTRCFAHFSIMDRDILVDYAADGRHPGPRSSEAFASRLFDFYRASRP